MPESREILPKRCGVPFNHDTLWTLLSSYVAINCPLCEMHREVCPLWTGKESSPADVGPPLLAQPASRHVPMGVRLLDTAPCSRGLAHKRVHCMMICREPGPQRVPWPDRRSLLPQRCTPPQMQPWRGICTRPCAPSSTQVQSLKTQKEPSNRLRASPPQNKNVRGGNCLVHTAEC